MSAKLADRIRERLDHLKLSPRKASMKAGMSPDGIRNIMRGNTVSPRGNTLQALAKVLQVPVEWLMEAEQETETKSGPMVLEKVFVRGHVQGGVWREAIEWDGGDWYSVTVPNDDRFPGVERFGLEVRGASMDKLYPEGTIVVVVRFSDLGRNPKPGERVICLRRNPSAEEYEATIKEYQLDEKGRHVLWPRSNDPEFQTPFILSATELPVSQGYEPLPRIAHARTYDDGSAPDIVISALVTQSVRRE